MSDYIIKQSTNQPVPMPEQPIYYTIKYTKEVETLDGKKVVVVDEQRTETVTKEGLESQKVGYQKMITEIDAKLAEIAKLEKS